MNSPWEKNSAAFEHFLLHTLVSDNPRLQHAMRYAVEGGGKRLRPWLIFQLGHVFGLPERMLWGAGAAVELVHCYSLVHDDLPGLDNSAERRGKPSCWKAFDEATAILAGDALLTLAFEVLAQGEGALQLIPELARVAGAKGMMAGQMFDVLPSQAPTPESLNTTNRLKTAELIAFSCIAPAIVAEKKPALQKKLRQFGIYLGLLYQLTDDFLDKNEDQVVTWAQLSTIPEAQQQADSWYLDAEEILQGFGEAALPLQKALHWVRHRVDFSLKL